MSMEIGDVAAGERLRFSMTRGENFRARFELYQNGAASGSCSAAVQGDPLDLSEYDSIAASAEVVGTDAYLFLQSTFVDKGAVDRPAVVSLLADRNDVEKVFATGANQAFTFTVIAIAPGKRDEILRGEVDVEDSAFGAVR